MLYSRLQLGDWGYFARLAVCLGLEAFSSFTVPFLELDTQFCDYTILFHLITVGLLLLFLQLEGETDPWVCLPAVVVQFFQVPRSMSRWKFTLEDFDFDLENIQIFS